MLLCDSNTEMQCTFLSSGGSSHCVWLCTLQKRRTCDAVTEEVLCVCVEFYFAGEGSILLITRYRVVQAKDGPFFSCTPSCSS